MLNHKSVALAALICTLGLPVWAIDLKLAYEGALANDANINAARAAALAGQEYLPQAQAQLLPSISASFTRSNNNLTSVTENSLGQLTESKNSYPSGSDTLSLRQPIYRRIQQVQLLQAESQVNDANAVLEVELQNLTVRVAGGYFEALLAEDQQALARTQLNTYKFHVDAARKVFEGGAGTRTDVDEAQARLDMAVAQELEARQAVASSRQLLETMVGTPLGELSKLDAPSLVLLPPDPEQLDAWIARAERASPELRSLAARLETAKLEIDKAKGGHHPTLDAVAQWSRSRSESIQALNSSYETGSMGVQLVIPIYAGGGVNSAIRQAVASKERAVQILEAARRDLGGRVHKEFRGVTEGILRVRALEQAARSSDQALLSSQKSFQAGVRTRIDVLNAESNRMSVLRDLAQARYLYLMSQVRLKALVNEANAATVEAMNSVFK